MNKTNSDIKYTSASKKSQTMHPGKIIEAYIESVEMTTETLSKTLGIPTENLKSIMTGDADCPFDIISKLAKITKIPLDKWLECKKQEDSKDKQSK
ncbi:helix-turn-helix transcriptional regulator [Megasphaera paucivorans]|uniref:Addiction module antidote protein, HigA family n=1 Tax=Megasphaera paucivorans TaxID=349095 RepID=A0A1G9Q8R4_9FIRM|nr:helix-turn-helix transcriptional regulator [Megasphaera paucivorans]SDM07349.1 hypothetical protein SAMN05660299_00147 [Megasphaera paucivorans]